MSVEQDMRHVFAEGLDKELKATDEYSPEAAHRITLAAAKDMRKSVLRLAQEIDELKAKA
jgi:hypothetical protein